MNEKDIKYLLEDVAEGRKKPEDALAFLRHLPFMDIEIAKHDNHRLIRNGFSEVMFCEGKRIEHILRIVEKVTGKGMNIFGTRASNEVGESIVKIFPKTDYDPVSRTFKIVSRAIEPAKGKLSIVCAGTADIFVAEEARRTAGFFGVEATKYYDVGVAGLNRLLSYVNELRQTDVLVVAAGMEGALPSVLGGLVSVPIVAVPTSVGYGTNFKGITALLAMLNSCSEGITVVNIDNGFGAACAALRILRNRQSG